MSTINVTGVLSWSLDRDQDGHREYTLKIFAVTDDANDGPESILAAVDALPEFAIGATWAFGNDVDDWAFCWPETKLTPVVENEPNFHWIIERKFSTKPLHRCQDASVGDPLLEPPKLSGHFATSTRQASRDRFGHALRYSSWEQITGALVEQDDSRPSVSISMPILVLPLTTFAQMHLTVNDSTLWGLAKRCVKLVNISWERVLYGVCGYYYQVTYEFDIRYDTWDRTIEDWGTRVLLPGGSASNPKHFRAVSDLYGYDGPVPLDGAGNIWDGSTGSQGTWTPQILNESNFLLLGIPTSL